MTKATYIIAEAGVNHNGSLDLALELIEAAVRTGADAVKFQTFIAANLMTETAYMADYQMRNTGKAQSQLDMITPLQLSFGDHFVLAERAARHGIDFLSTPFDLTSLAFLADTMGLATIKLPSGDITNGPYLLAAARTGRKLIMSTGMAELAEIADALDLLAWGYLDKPDPTARADFKDARLSAEGAALLAERVTVLQCTTEYPAAFDTINLRAIETLRREFNLPIGLSDHSAGISVPIAAVALGAVMIEKHLTLDRTMDGPDHKASLEPDPFREMVAGIRAVEQALGSPDKPLSAVELANRGVARKSIVAVRPIAAGTVITAEDIYAKRPGTGLSPMRTWEIIGQIATRAYNPGDLLV